MVLCLSVFPPGLKHVFWSCTVGIFELGVAAIEWFSVFLLSSFYLLVRTYLLWAEFVLGPMASME